MDLSKADLEGINEILAKFEPAGGRYPDQASGHLVSLDSRRKPVLVVSVANSTDAIERQAVLGAGDCNIMTLMCSYALDECRKVERSSNALDSHLVHILLSVSPSPSPS